MNTSAPNTAHYAQAALFSVMKSGGWFTTRQMCNLAKISDPRKAIATMIKNGYRFEKRTEYNSKKVRYKLYRLITEEEQV